MWLLFAIGSAFFAGVTAILAKCGIRKTDSTVATAIRTIVVLIFAWVMVLVVGSQDQIRNIDQMTLLFLTMSGLATGASWLCYFKALQIGDINKVVPIDRSSTVLTILLAFFLLGEPIGLFQGLGVVSYDFRPSGFIIQEQGCSRDLAAASRSCGICPSPNVHRRSARMETADTNRTTGTVPGRRGGSDRRSWNSRTAQRDPAEAVRNRAPRRGVRGRQDLSRASASTAPMIR